jgi:2-methylcitrate dehydratase
VVEFPLGHRRRRQEALPLLREKFRTALLRVYPERKAERIYRLVAEDAGLPELPVDRFLEELALP